MLMTACQTFWDGVQGRMCLMLGPPGSGKSSLLKILAGKIKDSKLVKVCCCIACIHWASVQEATSLALNTSA